MNWIKCALIASLVLTTGCASKSGLKAVIPQDGEKMVDIYRGAAADDHIGKQRTDKRVEELCKKYTELSARKRCQRGAQKLGLVPDQEENAGDKVLPPKKAPAQPAPLHADYVRSSANEVMVLFPRLPNPDIGIFIYPHLATKNEVPVPGYATVIPLYERVQYALPGESRLAP